MDVGEFGSALDTVGTVQVITENMKAVRYTVKFLLVSHQLGIALLNFHLKDNQCGDPQVF